jgi:tetratricopeptide (TPR) repeat protein
MNSSIPRHPMILSAALALTVSLGIAPVRAQDKPDAQRRQEERAAALQRENDELRRRVQEMELAISGRGMRERSLLTPPPAAPGFPAEFPAPPAPGFRAEFPAPPAPPAMPGFRGELTPQPAAPAPSAVFWSGPTPPAAPAPPDPAWFNREELVSMKRAMEFSQTYTDTLQETLDLMRQVLELFERPDVAAIYAAHRIEDLADDPKKAAQIIEGVLGKVTAPEVRRALLSKLSELYEEAGDQDKAIEACSRIIADAANQLAEWNRERGGE